METVTLEYLLTHKFKKTGLENIYEGKANASLRFAPNQLRQLPRSDKDKMAELKIDMMNIYLDKNITTAYFESHTNIKYNSFKKSLNRPQSRIHRDTLAKFVVGLGLSYEEANKLFALESQPLSPEHILLDAVVVHCIQNRYDINEMFDTCEQVKLNIFEIIE